MLRRRSPGRTAKRAYARVPVNGKLPIGPIPISPVILSPETLPVTSSVSGIGLVMETFQATSSPLVVPSKISVELPSAACVPVSAPPAFFKLKVALRSPIGVLMVMFQFPSTAICVSSFSSQNRNGSGISRGLGRRYSASFGPSPIVSNRRGAGGTHPVDDAAGKAETLNGEGRDLGPDQDHRNVQRPQ